MSIVTWKDGPHFKGSEPTRAQSKHEKRTADAAALAEAYADVDLRDGGYCWVTGRYTQPKHVDPRARREHHHLKGRRVRPDWVTNPHRIITVTAEAHQLITAGVIQVEGCDARKPIFFHWREGTKVKPFVIKARRHGADE